MYFLLLIQAHEILTAMVDRYERRKGTSAQNGKPQRAVTFDLAKYYPIYRDHLSEEEQAIDDAVTRLSSWQMVAAPRSAQGYYTKITLRLDHIQEIYEFLGRKPAQETRQEQLQLLLDAQRQNPDTLQPLRRRADGRTAGRTFTGIRPSGEC